MVTLTKICTYYLPPHPSDGKGILQADEMFCSLDTLYLLLKSMFIVIFHWWA